MVHIELRTRCGCSRRLDMPGHAAPTIDVPLSGHPLMWLADDEQVDISAPFVQFRTFRLWEVSTDTDGQRLYIYAEDTTAATTH